jgi:hypothetical protein
MKFIRPTEILDTGGSFSRASVANYFNNLGVLTQAAINQPRINFNPDTLELEGVLLETSSTNLLLNSSSLSTQTLSLTAQAYTLSFYGSGIITISGGHSYVVIGLGVNKRVSYTFTPTVGTCTFSVSGTATYAQLETGNISTSYITTTSSPASRSADICTGAGLIYSNILENDHPQWNSSNSYSNGDRVIRTTTHSIYEKVAGTAVNSSLPENVPNEWARVGPTNKYALFDESPSTLTTNTDIITLIIKPGRVNSLALLELEAVEVSVNLYAGGSRQFSGYTDLLNNNTVGNWYQYFYEPFYYQTSLALTDLVNAALLDLPIYSDSILTVTIRKPSGIAKVGALITGINYELGKTQQGMSISIADYSKKEPDDYGNITLVRRKFSKKVRGTFFLYSNKVDAVVNLLTQYRATPVVWIGIDSNYSSLVVYGFYRDWEINIPNNIGSICSIDIEGLA